MSFSDQLVCSPLQGQGLPDRRTEPVHNDDTRRRRVLSASRDMLWSPTIRAALIAGTPWLDVFCPGCGTSRAVDLPKVDRHPLASVAPSCWGCGARGCGASPSRQTKSPAKSSMTPAPHYGCVPKRAGVTGGCPGRVAGASMDFERLRFVFLGLRRKLSTDRWNHSLRDQVPHGQFSAQLSSCNARCRALAGELFHRLR
jgi:hypothetical protein